MSDEFPHTFGSLVGHETVGRHNAAGAAHLNFQNRSAQHEFFTDPSVLWELACQLHQQVGSKAAHVEIHRSLRSAKVLRDPVVMIKIVSVEISTGR